MPKLNTLHSRRKKMSELIRGINNQLKRIKNTVDSLENRPDINPKTHLEIIEELKKIDSALFYI
jgi:hypothetical protein